MVRWQPPRSLSRVATELWPPERGHNRVPPARDFRHSNPVSTLLTLGRIDEGKVLVRKSASIAAIVLGALLVIGGVGTWIVVSGTLSDQQITTSEDACLPNRTVAGPFTAYCEAKVIERHTLESTGGLYYAEMDREDPLRQVAATSAFLQSSLFTSVLAFGVAAMAAGMGLLFILIGLGMRDVEQRTTPARTT